MNHHIDLIENNNIQIEIGMLRKSQQLEAHLTTSLSKWGVPMRCTYDLETFFLDDG